MDAAARFPPPRARGWVRAGNPAAARFTFFLPRLISPCAGRCAESDEQPGGKNDPGDVVLARDVAFSAMHWGLGGQAYPLLKRVAAARPFGPQIYLAIGQCLADLNHADRPSCTTK